MSTTDPKVPYFVRFQISTVTSMNMAVLWDVSLCSLLGIDRFLLP